MVGLLEGGRRGVPSQVCRHHRGTTPQLIHEPDVHLFQEVLDAHESNAAMLLRSSMPPCRQPMSSSSAANWKTGLCLCLSQHSGHRQKGNEDTHTVAMQGWLMTCEQLLPACRALPC